MAVYLKKCNSCNPLELTCYNVTYLERRLRTHMKFLTLCVASHRAKVQGLLCDECYCYTFHTHGQKNTRIEVITML